MRTCILDEEPECSGSDCEDWGFCPASLQMMLEDPSVRKDWLKELKARGRPIPAGATSAWRKFLRDERGKLKRCPFCGQRASLWKDDDGFWYAGCREGFCGVSPCTSGQETKREAAETWNIRARRR